TVFLSLSVMALGAGTFKPIISGSIARMTTKENSSLGFGVFYWTINLGAFLFPLFLIPYLKNNIGWNWVFIAAALGTGAMLIPTLLFFKEPPRPKDEKKKETNLVQTIANAFEIIYSPFILIFNQLKARNGRGILAYAFIALFGIGAVYSYLQIPTVEEKLNSHIFSVAGNELMITVDRNAMGNRDYAISARERQTFPPYTLTLMTEAKNDRRELFAPVAQDGNDLALTLYSTNLDSIFTLVSNELKPFFTVERDSLERMVQNLLTRQNNQFDLTIYKPDAFEKYAAELLPQLQENPGFSELTPLQLGDWIKASEKPTSLTLTVDENVSGADGFEIIEAGAADYQLRIADVSAFSAIKTKALNQLRSFAPLARIPQSRLDKMVDGTNSRSFLWLFV
ncbi:MFS transporter, partial [bacterium]|nr:MFS transporter [bacterium]